MNEQDKFVTVVAVRAEQVELMLHCIGYTPQRVKRGKYIAFRNYFTTNGPRWDWDRLVEYGYAEVEPFSKGCSPDAKMYSVTRKGMDFLEGITGIKIEEGD